MEVNYLWLIPLVPLVSSAVIRFLGKKVLPRSLVHLIACSSVFVSFSVTVYAFFALKGLPEEQRYLTNGLFPWLDVGMLQTWIRFHFDPLSAVMTLVVTGVGFLIHLYSAGYMSHEKEYERYFAYLNLFMAMMLILVLADSLILMFVGWEGVGLCSYLLIGFWFGIKENADAGKKAFIVNRIGDFGFILGMLTLFWTLGLETNLWSFDISVLRNHADVFSNATVFGVPALTFATLMLFVGATGKSAQIPLYVWLPDAMAGPTPVSALIHAATMVTAGVYMIARLSFLFDQAPFTLNIVACVGAATAFFAATIGVAQNDIKKVLAYSTVSQLGYMFLACGVGAYASGIFHLMTHAFFKALLFLGAGSVIHAMSGEQDIRKMGGLRKKIPHTYRTFLIATLAIAGVPPLAGFFSKDEILWQAWNQNPVLWLVAVVAALLTAFYMFRLLFLTFFGECRANEEVKHHIHESPLTMILPLMILAGLSVVGGWVWWPSFIPISQIFPHWLETVVVVNHPHGSHSLEAILAFASLAVAGAGIYVAYQFYCVRTELPNFLATRWSGVYRLIQNKYWVDEIYERVFVNGTKRLSQACFWFDSKIVDGMVNGASRTLRILVLFDGTFDRWVVDGLVNFMGHQTAALGRQVRRLQTGQIQTYLGALAIALAAISLVWVSRTIGS